MCGQGGFIRAKKVVFGANNLHSGKVVVFGQKWRYSGNSGFIRESGRIPTKVVVFEKMAVFWQSGCARSKVVVIEQSSCIRAEWFYSGKVVVFGQKWLRSGKSGCNRQNGCIRAK